jgi:cytochrome c553
MSISATSPGIVYKDLLIMGSIVSETLPASPGDIRAYDTRTGKIRWTFHTIPHPGEFGYETWPKDAWQYIGAANNWAGMSLDEKRGLVFVPTGSAAFDFYGSNRKGDDLFANTLLALKADTGERVWHFQAVHHDLWDRDFPRRPTWSRSGTMAARWMPWLRSRNPAMCSCSIAQTGQPLFPIEERPAPAPKSMAKRPRRRSPAAEAAAFRAPDLHRRYGHEPHARSARRRPRAPAAGAQRGPICAAQPGRHRDLSGLRWRRGVGRRGLRSGVRVALRQRQRDALDSAPGGVAATAEPAAAACITRCAGCHRQDRKAALRNSRRWPILPRRTREQIAAIDSRWQRPHAGVRAVAARMPSSAIVAYLTTGEDLAVAGIARSPWPIEQKYRRGRRKGRHAQPGGAGRAVRRRESLQELQDSGYQRHHRRPHRRHRRNRLSRRRAGDPAVRAARAATGGRFGRFDEAQSRPPRAGRAAAHPERCRS